MRDPATLEDAGGQRRLRVGLFLTHPVQYHVCLWRGLAARQGWDVEVFYFSDQGVAGSVDPDFGEVVSWDVPLLDGYAHRFLRKERIEEVDRATIPDLESFLRKENFDVVFLHGYTHAFARQLAQRKKKFGYELILHGEFTDMPRPGRRWWKDRVKEVYLRWFYRRVDHFCPIGHDAIAHLQKRGISQDEMTLTPYAVDDALIEDQRKQFSRESRRSALGIEKDQVVFLFSGKLMPRKQPLLLARAAAALADDDRLALIVLGSGEQFEEVEQLLRPRLGQRLHLPGFVNQSQLGGYFAAADVFVLPSAYDTWGLVVNEAMHWGLPCIVSDRTGCRSDLISEGETGFVHHWNSVDELEDRMRRFLDDPGMAQRMGVRARDRIEGFRSGVVVERLREAIEKTGRPVPA